MIKECKFCNEEFKTNIKKKKYCSEKCRKAARNQRKREARLKEKKCKYCGKTFMGNDKTVYCSKDCAKKAKQDYDMNYHWNRWYNDDQYRQEKTEKQLGTFNIQDNLNKNGERDWEKEAEIINALKKQAGLKKRSVYY